ncbi:sensor of ECF-type sigma factor [Flavobacteriaceae bacterium F08102]|nr:sensor of ECF-type sigma factor [Flavobacteriaceae bacterium F08102]
MKRINYILLVTLCIASMSAFGQESNKEKMKAFKTAYITDALDLTPAEAEKFWPIYNAYEEKIDKIRFGKSKEIYKKIRNAGGVDKASDELANEYLQSYLDTEIQMANEKRDLYKKLKGVFSAKKAILLVRAEHSFSRELLKRFRDERKPRK